MTSRCFNPACCTPFRYFRSGKIFAISSASRKNETGDTEYFWLCGACAAAFNISVSAAGAVILEPSEPGQTSLEPSLRSDIDLGIQPIRDVPR